jgi:hypothetical protein
MNIQCTQLDSLLLEGDAFSLETAARHAEGCAACAEKLAEWNELSTVAASMRTTWKNDMLWPRIERAVERERRRGWTELWQAAAAILIFVALGSAVWFAGQRTKFDLAILRPTAIADVERAEREHVAAIDRLEKLAGPKLDTPATPLMVSYKEKLMLLDDAIAECQSNIQHNRDNAYLRKQLLSAYSEKQRTLQDVLREETHVSNQ